MKRRPETLYGRRFFLHSRFRPPLPAPSAEKENGAELPLGRQAIEIIWRSGFFSEAFGTETVRIPSSKDALQSSSFTPSPT